MNLLLGIIVVAIIVSSYFLLLSLGKNKSLFSFTKDGEIEFRMTGGTLNKIMPNVSGYYLEESSVEFEREKGVRESITAKRFFPLPNEQKSKKNFLGLFWIGIPPRKILEYDFSWDMAISKQSSEEEKKKGRAVEETEFGDFWISHRTEIVNSLYFRYTYPIVVRGVELKGIIPIDIAFNVTIETVVPIIPVIFLKGRWFLPFTAIFKGIISDNLKGMEFADFEQIKKGEVLGKAIKKENDRFIRATGMKALNVDYKDYAKSGTEEEKAAISAEKIAQLKARAAIAESEGKSKAIINIAKAEAEKINLERLAKATTLIDLLEAAKGHPKGAYVLIEQIRTEGLEAFGGQVLSLTPTSGLQIAVNAGDENKKADAKTDSNKKK